MAEQTIPFQKIVTDVKIFLKDHFNLHEDEANQKATIKSIEKGVIFRGANLWILIFAIMVCSVGLNVNSTAVVIGAMLISPLMGPIMGVGLGIGIYDFKLIILGLKNLLIAVVLSLLASVFYFLITPLDVANTELLARTTPTIWDVLIALFGGIVGIIACTREEKSNAIPGVAIATALMPPLCTAGYGIATFQWNFFFGAMYLFFINCVFITIATYTIIRLLRYSKKEFVDEARRVRVKRYIFTIVALAVIPSIFTAYTVVSKSLFNQHANNFIKKELVFENAQVISANLVFENDLKQIQVTLFGEPVDLELIEERKKRLPDYGLGDTELIVRQGYQKEEGIDLVKLEQMNLQLKTGIIEELYTKNESLLSSKNEQIKVLENEIFRLRSYELPISDLAREAKAINDNIRQMSITSTVLSNVDSMTFDTLIMAYVDYKVKPRKMENTQLETWLKARMKVDVVKMISD